jgi:hypothetical protein
MALLYAAATGGASFGRLGGEGQFLIACVGVSASIVAQIASVGFTKRTFHKLTFVFLALYLVAISSGLYGAVALPANAAMSTHPEGVAAVSLLILASAGLTGLFAAGL